MADEFRKDFLLDPDLTDDVKTDAAPLATEDSAAPNGEVAEQKGFPSAMGGMIPKKEGIWGILQTVEYGWCKFISYLGFSSKYFRSSKKRKKIFLDVVTYTILCVIAVIMLYPLWWMLMASLAYNQNAMLETVFFPGQWATQNRGGNASLFWHYDRIVRLASSQNMDYWRSIGVSLLFSLAPVIVGLITSTMAAFAFSKLNFKGKNVVFFYCLAAIMVPGPSIMIAQYCIYNLLGWTQNGMAMIIPGMFGAVLTAFFIRQYLYSLPTSIIEAAKIDGAGYWRIFWTFIIPLAMPAIAAQFILSFIGCWNNYLGPLLFVSSKDWYPLALIVQQMDVAYGTDVNNAPAVMAISVLALLPVLVLFAVFQKMIIGSIMLTGSKE